MKTVSLFSGCGGMDLGFTQNGFQITEAYDSDRTAITCYNANHEAPATLASVSASFPLEQDINVLIAGPPCQGFSTVGKNCADDKRNFLFLETCEIAARTQPKVLVLENVSGITNKINKPLYERGLSILREAGFHIECRLLDCSEFGVPQRRRRNFVVARSNNRPFSLDGIKSSTRLNLGAVIFDLDSADKFHRPRNLEHGSRAWQIAKNIQPGQKLCNVRGGTRSIPTWAIPAAFGQTSAAEREILVAIRHLRRTQRRRAFGDADPVCLSNLEIFLGRKIEEQIDSLLRKNYVRFVQSYIDLTNTFNGKYRRLSFDDDSPTVDTRFGDPSLFLHPSEDRGMTIREAARIQGFPDDFEFVQSKACSFRLIGNAVPPPVASAVANTVRQLI